MKSIIIVLSCLTIPHLTNDWVIAVRLCCNVCYVYLAVTMQLYGWSCPSVCLSICFYLLPKQAHVQWGEVTPVASADTSWQLLKLNPLK